MNKQIIRQTEYFGQAVTVYTTKSHSEHWKPYPYLFEIKDTEGHNHRYTGVPNYCGSVASALKRAWYRCKWISEKTLNQRYKNSFTIDIKAEQSKKRK